MHGERPGLREPGRGCVIDLYIGICGDAVSTTSTGRRWGRRGRRVRPEAVSTGVRVVATMSKPPTGMVGEWHGDGQRFENQRRGYTVGVNPMVGVVAVLTTSMAGFGPAPGSAWSAWTSGCVLPHTAPTAAVRAGGTMIPDCAQAPRVATCAAGTAGDAVQATACVGQAARFSDRILDGRLGIVGSPGGSALEVVSSEYCQVVEISEPHRSAHGANGGLSISWHHGTSRPASGVSSRVWPCVRRDSAGDAVQATAGAARFHNERPR